MADFNLEFIFKMEVKYMTTADDKWNEINQKRIRKIEVQGCMQNLCEKSRDGDVGTGLKEV